MNTDVKTKILQVNTQDVGGGAERVALDLHRSYLLRNIDAKLLVKYKRSQYASVYETKLYEGVTKAKNIFSLLDRWLSRQPHFRGRDSLRLWLSGIVEPRRWYDTWRGLVDYKYTFQPRLLYDGDWMPDIVHLHNLHGGYFDIRLLPSLCKNTLVVWTLHDTWALTGHCAYFIDCSQWIHGCGNCPDLTRPPSVRRDYTAHNWRVKHEIYKQSQLHIVSPSRWLISRINESTIHPKSVHVIPNGVDLSIFKPGDKQIARRLLGLDPQSFICLFVSTSGAAVNPYKDYNTIENAIQQLLHYVTNESVQFVCLGKRSASQGTNPYLIFPGYIRDVKRVALYYQAADIYLHAANAENFPCTILEAQACGLPVIATSVGGIPEQIVMGSTGYLVSRGDAIVMKNIMIQLMHNRVQLMCMSQNAAYHVKNNFSLDRQINDYLSLYEQLGDNTKYY